MAETGRGRRPTISMQLDAHLALLSVIPGSGRYLMLFTHVKLKRNFFHNNFAVVFQFPFV